MITERRQNEDDASLYSTSELESTGKARKDEQGDILNSVSIVVRHAEQYALWMRERLTLLVEANKWKAAR